MARRNKKLTHNQFIEEPKEEKSQNTVEKESMVLNLKTESPEESQVEETEFPKYEDDGLEDGDTCEEESEDILEDIGEEVEEVVPVIKKGHADLRMNRRLGIF